jgi:hypothetical protein
MSTILRPAAAVFFVAHGVAHLVGFMGSWRLAEFKDAPYSTLIFNGAIDVGDAGMRIVGVLWLAGAAAFIGAAVAIWRGRIGVVAAVALFSLAVCAIGLPAAIVGLGVDIGILVVLAVLVVVRPTVLQPAVR